MMKFKSSHFLQLPKAVNIIPLAHINCDEYQGATKSDSPDLRTGHTKRKKHVPVLTQKFICVLGQRTRG